MKLFSNSSSLKSRAYYFYQNIQIRFFSTTPTQIRNPKHNLISDSLYSRIAPLGNPNVSVLPELNQWIGEGKYTFRWELRNIINRLMISKRFEHALEVSLWMTNKRGHPIAPFDVAVRLKLIFKVYGLEQVENYFDKIPESLKTFHVYLAILNCYTMAKSLDKAESIMQKATDLGYVSKAIWYNLMMNLHYQLGNMEKLVDLLSEMGEKGIPPDHFTLSNCLNACATSSDTVGMDKIVSIMESGPHDIVHHGRTYVIAAEGYLKMGLNDKALTIMKNIEGKLTASNRSDFLFLSLFTFYSEAGEKDGLYRIWEFYTKKNKFANNKVYISMMRALNKFGDIEGMEKILEEWDSSRLCIDFRVPNYLIDAYCSYGCLEKAGDLIIKYISKGGNPLVLTWCHLAGGYLKKNELPEAIEALKKATSVCPPKFKKIKEYLTTCLEYLEKGDYTCMEKAEELIKFVRTKGISTEVCSGDTCSSIKDVGYESCVEGQNLEGIFASEDVGSINDKGNIEVGT